MIMKLFRCWLLLALFFQWGQSAETNSFGAAIEQNRRGIQKQIELAQNAHNEVLVKQLEILLANLDHYQTADNDPNRGTAILFDPRTKEYARMPATALILNEASRTKWTAYLPTSATGSPVSFARISGRLSEAIVLIPATYKKDSRGFVVPTVDSKQIDDLSRYDPPRIGVIVDPVTHDALGGVQKP